MDKSKYRDGLRAVRRYIPRLEQDLELLRLQAENKSGTPEDKHLLGSENSNHEDRSDLRTEASNKLKQMMIENDEQGESTTYSDIVSDSEDLSDIFETDSDEEDEDETEEPLYLDEFEKFHVHSNGEEQDFEEHLRQISSNSRKEKSVCKDADTPDLDEVDRMILQATSLLKKKKKKR